jgi:hypothetical protein
LYEKYDGNFYLKATWIRLIRRLHLNTNKILNLNELTSSSGKM